MARSSLLLEQVVLIYHHYLVCLKVNTKGESSTSVFLFLVASPFKSPLAADDGREVDGLPLFFPWVGKVVEVTGQDEVERKSLGVFT